MKRVSNWPQAWLGWLSIQLRSKVSKAISTDTGLAINWGFVVAWLDRHGEENDFLFITCVMVSLAW
jgi:hypothetical protein